MHNINHPATNGDFDNAAGPFHSIEIKRFFETRPPISTIETGADQMKINLFILLHHHIGGEAGFEFFAAGFAGEFVDIFNCLTKSSNS
jgi:hypothetical protein